MKFTLSVAVLALAASQAMAVVPIPIKGCTKEVMVLPTDTGCDAFAAANGCTFADLLKWNDKLRPDCLNLDVGHPLCVSVTPGAGGNNTTAPAVPKPSATGAAPSGTVTSVPVVPPKATSSGAAATTTTGGPNAQVSTVAKVSSATSTKASMLLGAAGVIMSAVYML
ncbi:hypothetical protein BG006_004271 [Podila minutissima]|uniref:LysM domain-containing protein n=1 Tax=Podila minutissima TaxID=64525 RepID=A0A9P5SLA3_9FUNG|nr:hypothetical protein BG006_004271 [Podila minutissima]